MTSLRGYLRYLALVVLGLGGTVATFYGSSTHGGQIFYYNGSTQVGYWYKPCTGNQTKWGVVGTTTEIGDFYSCEGGPEPPACVPTVTHDNPPGQTPMPSLVCGIG
jgi:hypothetical protein